MIYVRKIRITVDGTLFFLYKLDGTHSRFRDSIRNWLGLQGHNMHVMDRIEIE